MDIKLLGTAGLAAVSTAMLMIGLVGNTRAPVPVPSERLNDLPPGSDAPESQLAFSTLFPAFVPNDMPIPDMADIAAEAALGAAEPDKPAKPDGAELVVPIKPPTPAGTGANTGAAIPDDASDSGGAIKSGVASGHAIAGNATRQPPQRSDKRVSAVAFSSITASELLQTPATMGSFLSSKAYVLQPETGRFLTRVSAAASLESREFNTLLKADGFTRPEWQDLSFASNLEQMKERRKRFTVMIDPGHGGSDPGTKGYNGLLEKDLTLDIARRVRLFLTEIEEIDVQLTRNHDYGLSRQSRVNTIRRGGADMVISLHFNHLPQTQVNLVESFYAGPDNIRESHSASHISRAAKMHKTASNASQGNLDLSFTEGSARLARDLQQRVFTEVSFENGHAQDAGVKQQTLFVLTRSLTPGVLLEISCLSHAQEADRLTTDAYRNRLAAALVDGIRNYHDSLQRAPLKQAGDLDV